MKKRVNRRAQMKLSFGMIFSIILIIVFLFVAFYAIRKFLSLQDAIKVGQFKDGLQSDIDKLWKGTQGSQKEIYYLPNKIEYACFVDYSSSRKGANKELYRVLKQVFYEKENLIFSPIGSAEGLDAFSIEHINITEITKENNPLCIKNIKGRVELVVSKDYGENLVEVKKI